VHLGNNATIYSPNRDYNPAEWAKFQGWLDRVYNDFTSKVAEGRKLPKEKVLEIAKGRIWTGADAKENGLVDELGGYPVALNLAKKAAGIGENEKVRLRLFPRAKGLWGLLERADNSEREAVETALVRALQTLQPLARQMRLITTGARRDILAMPTIDARP
jgi:protease-4